MNKEKHISSENNLFAGKMHNREYGIHQAHEGMHLDVEGKWE